MRALSTILLLLLAACSPDRKDRWEKVWEDERGVTWMDRESMSRPRKGIVGVWLRLEYAEGYGGNRVGGARAFSEFNCTQRAVRVTSTQSYDPSGNPVENSSKPNEPFQAIPPESALETVYNEVCR